LSMGTLNEILLRTGKALRENGLGDGVYVETVSGGLGANSEAPIDRMYDMATEDKSGVDDGTMSRVCCNDFKQREHICTCALICVCDVTRSCGVPRGWV